MNWDAVLAPIIAVLATAIVTVLFRLIDQYIPDTTGQHPLPTIPGTTTIPHPAAPGVEVPVDDKSIPASG